MRHDLPGIYHFDWVGAAAAQTWRFAVIGLDLPKLFKAKTCFGLRLAWHVLLLLIEPLII
jgi:hypothetical protein